MVSIEKDETVLHITEYYFTDVLWPDFDEPELDKAIASYQKRERRFGGRK